MNNNGSTTNIPTIRRLSSNRFVGDDIYHENNKDGNEFLFEDSIDQVRDIVTRVKEGGIVKGVVTKVDDKYIIVDVDGLKSGGRVPKKELGCDDSVTVGSEISVFVERLEDYNGNVVLSREKAIKDEKWNKLEEDAATESEIKGVIKRSIKCGCVVDLSDGISAFLPLSHIDSKQVKDIKDLIETEQKFIILKMDKKQGNIVVSRKKVLEKLCASEKAKFLETLNEGDIIEGKVKSITSYGVFVGIHESNEVGVIDGLLHITDISWSRVSHPSSVFTTGETIKAKIIKIDRESAKISLGVKQLEPNPWENVESKYPVDSIHKGYVTSIEDYGLFVELEPGIEGLVHSSEISWTRSNLPISNLATRGQEVYVKILGIDIVKARMSLSMKGCVANPCQVFIDKYPPGSIISGKVVKGKGKGKDKDNTEYISVGFDDSEIDESVEGVIHAKDISWSKDDVDAIRKYNIGDEIKAKVIRANVNRAKIHLGIKQIEYDPLEELIKKVKVGDKMHVTVIKREDNGLLVETKNEAIILIELEHLPENKKFSISEEIEVKVLGIEKYKIVLSAQ